MTRLSVDLIFDVIFDSYRETGQIWSVTILDFELISRRFISSLLGSCPFSYEKISTTVQNFSFIVCPRAKYFSRKYHYIRCVSYGELDNRMNQNGQ